MKIYPVIDLFQILTAFLKFLNVLSFFASNLIFKLFLPYALSSLLTVNSTLLRLPFFASIMTFYLLLIVVKSLLLSFLISLLLLTLSTIKSCLIDLLSIMASLALLFLYSAPISLIALSMFWFNLPPLQPTTSLLVFLKALFLVLFFSLSTPLLSVISLITQMSPFSYTPMILNSTSLFL